MFLEIPDLLSSAEVAQVNALSTQAIFADGRASNPANDTKQNLQAKANNSSTIEAGKILATAYARSQAFRDFAFPSRIATPRLCRYDVGMKYGAHADAPFMDIGEPTPLRSDLSSTVFLVPPETYEGGELVIYLGTVPVTVKLKAGFAIVYPSTAVHEVRPVTAGMRLVGIAFIESIIRDEFKRTQLYELNEIAALEGLKMDRNNRIRFEAVRANLTRLWSGE